MLPTRLALPAEVVEIAERLERAGFETWCVGGAIRDALLGGSREDVDLATAATPEQVQALFPKTIPVGLKFGTVGVLDRKRHLHEVTTFRRDVRTDGRHAVVEYGASIDEDLARRDFTINAIAYHPMRYEWRDPFAGAEDLGRRVVRAVGEAHARFREDYLRILRAIRFASRLDFDIDPVTWDAAREEAAGLGRLSAERVRDEWFRSLETGRSVRRVVDLWREVGAAAGWIPGLRAGYPIATDDPAPRDPVLLTIALVTDSAGVLERLKASSAEIQRGRRIDQALLPPAPGDVCPETVRRWLSAAEPAADDLATLHRWRTGAAPPWSDTVAQIRSRGDPLTRGDLAVTGDDLKAIGIPAGPAIGRVLGGLLDWVLEDPARNRRDQLLERAASLR